MTEDSTLTVPDSSSRHVRLKNTPPVSSHQFQPSQATLRAYKQPTGPPVTVLSPTGYQKSNNSHHLNSNQIKGQLRHSNSSSSTSSSYSNPRTSTSSSPAFSYNSAFSSPSGQLGANQETPRSLSQNASSSDDETKESNKTTNFSLRSMSSIATSFESIYEPLLEEPNRFQKHSDKSHSTSSTHSSSTTTTTTVEPAKQGAPENTYHTPQSSADNSGTAVTPTIFDFNFDNVLQPSMTPPRLEIYSFDSTILKPNPTSVFPENSNSTTTTRSSNNESFSSASTPGSPVSSAIHDDSNLGIGQNKKNTNTNSSASDDNFPLPFEPGQKNTLKYHKSCSSLKSNASHQPSLKCQASVSSFSKSFSRPLSNSRPSSIHNEPASPAMTTTKAPITTIDSTAAASTMPQASEFVNTNELLGVAIDRPPEGFAQNPTVIKSPSFSTLDPKVISRQQFNISQTHLHNNNSDSNNSKANSTGPVLLKSSSIPNIDPLTIQKPRNTDSRPQGTRNTSHSSLNSLPNSQPLPAQNNTPIRHHTLPIYLEQGSSSNTNPVFLPRQRSSVSSASPRNSFRHSQDIRSSGIQTSSSVTFLRRRSMLPQNMVSAPTEEQTGYYKEQVKAMRELKRRRQEFEQDDRVLVGKTISEGHVNYSIAYNMLTGIRVSVSRCNAKVDRELTEADFTAKHKLAFDISGNELIPSSKYDFKFKDYAPLVFRHLRALFQLDPADYLMSLTNKYILSELSSPGKSGSLFYYSRDYRFIIKTVHHSEHKTLRKILKDYYNHVKTNPNTLISRFYGLHRIKLPWGKKVHFIVMNNLFPPYYDLRRTYDLKGSTLGREYISKAGTAAKPTAVFKDLNWIKNKEHLSLGPTKSKQFLSQLERDVKLLKKLNVMDYSLLIGVYDFEKADRSAKPQSVYLVEPAHGENLKGRDLRKAVHTTSPTEMTTMDIDEYRFGDQNFVFYSDQGGFQSSDENDQPLSEIYFLGVIDCLTPYTFFKRVETFWKSLQHNRASVSAVPSSEYGDRFLKFMNRTIKGKKSAVKVKVNQANTAGIAAAGISDVKLTSNGLDENVVGVKVEKVQGPSGMPGIPGINAKKISCIVSNEPESGQTMEKNTNGDSTNDNYDKSEQSRV